MIDWSLVLWRMWKGRMRELLSLFRWWMCKQNGAVAKSPLPGFWIFHNFLQLISCNIFQQVKNQLKTAVLDHVTWFFFRGSVACFDVSTPWSNFFRKIDTFRNWFMMDKTKENCTEIICIDYLILRCFYIYQLSCVRLPDKTLKLQASSLMSTSIFSRGLFLLAATGGRSCL